MNRMRVVCVSVLSTMPTAALAGTIRVPQDYPSIGIAIAEAEPFDTIIVAPGTYFEAINFGGKVIVVQSENPKDPAVVAATIVDAGGLGAVVTFSGGEDQVNTILDGFTITGGTIGIDAHSSRAIVRRCVIRDNSSYGIYQADGVIEDTQVVNNNGVGLNDCDGDIRRCLVRNNNEAGLRDCDGTLSDSEVVSSRGHGIVGGNLDILRSVIGWNSSSGMVSFGSPSPHRGDIDQSFIIGNGSHGINANGYDDSSLVRNSVIAGNRDSGFLSSRKHVLNCTVTGNRQYGFQNHTGTIRHVILWDNLLGALNSSTTPQFSGTANPYFFAPGYWDTLNNVWVDGDYHLTQNSSFIDAGDPNYPSDLNATAQDIDGSSRVVGARVDIGAYEFQAECGDDDFDGDETPDNCDRDIDGDGIWNVPDQCDYTADDVTVGADGRPLADLDHDCDVDLHDHALMQRSFGGPE